MNFVHNMSYRAIACLITIAFLGMAVTALVAVVTGEWRWLCGTALCYAIVRPLFR